MPGSRVSQREGREFKSPGPKSSNAGGLAVAAFAIYFLVGTAAVILFGRPMDGGSLVERVEATLSGTLIAIAALFLFVAHCPPHVRFWRRGVLGPAALWYAGFFALWGPTAMLVYPWFLEQLGGRLEMQRALLYFAQGGGDSLTNWLTMLAVACLLVPMVEEILFRGYLQQALKGFLPTWSAVVATAVLFGLIHGPAYAAPIGLLGLLLGWLRERFGCLSVAIFAHALHNTVTISVTLFFPQFTNWLYGE